MTHTEHNGKLHFIKRKNEKQLTMSVKMFEQRMRRFKKKLGNKFHNFKNQQE